MGPHWGQHVGDPPTTQPSLAPQHSDADEDVASLDILSYRQGTKLYCCLGEETVSGVKHKRLGITGPYQFSLIKC